MTEAQAQRPQCGFGVDVSYQENDSVTEGTVISWNPNGKSISAAVTALNNAGFYNIGFCDQNGNPVSGNEDATVTGVSPPASSPPTARSR